MAKVTFALEKKPCDRTGQEVDTIVKKVEGQPDEDWCSVVDLDQLFEACVARWGANWDLEKVKMAIRGSDID